jgi:CRP-like cAMP-binding protein
MERSLSAMQSCAISRTDGRSRPLLDWCAELALAGGWPMLFGREHEEPAYASVARYCGTIMRVSGRLRPSLIYRTPRYRAAKAECFRFVRGEIERRATTDRMPDSPDVLDCLMADGGLDARESTALALLGMVGCTVYINRVAAFMLHHAYRNRELLDALRDEVDRAFALGLDHERLRGMSLLHGLYLEALRLHPIWFVVPFQAVKDFAFDGCQVRKGELLAISPVQEHFLAEHYPQPETFDPFRCMPPRVEHRHPGVFTPYGAGNRKCVALGMAEVLSLLTAAVMIHRVDGDVVDAGPKVYLDPLPGPRTTLRHANRRTPTGTIGDGGRGVTGSRSEVAPLLPSERELFLEKLSAVRDRILPPGDVVLRQGDPGDELFLIQSGEAHVFRTFAGEGERSVAKLGPGDVFGELALLRSGPRSATVRAAGSSPLLVSVVERDTYLDLIRECNLTGKEIFELVRQGRMLPALTQSFPQLCAEHRAAVLPLLQEIDVAPGEAVVREGDASDAMYVILEGRFEVRSGDRLVASLGPGDYFGEVGMLQDVRRTATVLAAGVEPARVVKFSASAVDKLLELDAVRDAITRVMRQRLETGERTD